MARRSSTVTFLSAGREDVARAKWAFVGGLKDESRTYRGPLLECLEDGLRTWKVSEDDVKD